MYRLLLLLILFSLINGYSSAQPQVKVVQTEKAPVIDGYVNDEVWQNAALINELYQREPKPGEPVSEKTEFLFLYDRNNIYVGIRCYDDPDGITAKSLRAM